MKTFIFLLAILLAHTFVAAVENGEPVSIRDAPFYASVFSGGFSCGASIVGSKWILTAAHCGAGGNIASLTIRTGTDKLNDNKDRYEVEAFHVPPNRNNIRPDIALIELKKSIPFNSVQRSIPIACAATTQLKRGQSVKVLGLGKTETGQQPDNLRQIDITIVKVEQDYSVFTAGVDGMHHIGAGDSGGPAVYDGVLVGIASIGNKGKNEVIQGWTVINPDTYVDVREYESWIASVSRGEVGQNCPGTSSQTGPLQAPNTSNGPRPVPSNGNGCKEYEHTMTILGKEELVRSCNSFNEPCGSQPGYICTTTHRTVQNEKGTYANVPNGCACLKPRGIDYYAPHRH